MYQPRISIVMPSYNSYAFIEEAINSVLNQNYTNFELIIVDGCSNDGTVDIIKKFQQNSHISKIIIEKDKGQADALYKGFTYCTGDIYAWLNSDDSFAEDAFQTVAYLFENKRDTDVLNGQLSVINKNSEFIAIWPRRKITNRQWLHYPQTIGQPSTFFTSGIYKKVGGINAGYHFAMDYDLFFRFALANANFEFSDIQLANFRVHDVSKTMALPHKFWKEEIKVFYKLSNKKIVSLFYYWKFRGIVSTIIKQKILRRRQF